MKRIIISPISGLKTSWIRLFVIGILFLMSDTSFSQESEELNLVNTQIEALRAKRDWVKSVPEEDSIAVAQNWYEKMDEQLSALFDKKRNLIKSQTGKTWVSIEEFNEVLEKKKPILLADENYIIEQK